MIALDPLDELERTGAVGFGLGVRSLHDVLVDHVQALKEIEHEWTWLLRVQDDRVLVRRLERAEPVALVHERARADLRIANAEEVVLDVVTGEVAAVVER